MPILFYAPAPVYTKLLLHMDGADDGTIFTDDSESNHTITRFNAVTKTAIKKFGTASGYFDGTGDYLSIADSDDWVLGSGDFTVDYWLRITDKSATFMLWEQIFGGLFQQFYWITNSYLTFVANDGNELANYIYAWVPTNGTWYHLALVRNGTTLTLYIDGTEFSPTTINTAINGNTLPDVNTALTVGGRDGGAVSLPGYIDEFRWSKGIARWTSNFTPPTEPYTT